MKVKSIKIMEILNDLLQFVRPFDSPIEKLFVGVHWTVVMSRVCGIASTQIEPPPHFNQQIRDVGHLHEKSAFEIGQFAQSEKWLEASVGMAAINSLIEIDENKCKNENAYDTICEEGAGKNVAIIGHFPFVKKLKSIAGRLWVIELQPREGDHDAEKTSEILPQCDVVGISATTLINHTLENVLKYCRQDALKIMIGPTTPMSPVLFDYGIDILAGSKIYDPQGIMRGIEQGGNFRQLHGIQVLTMRKQ